MAALITAVGFNIIAERIKGNGTEPVYLAWGTGVTEPTITDTDLEAEDSSPAYARVAGVSSIVDGLYAGDTYQVSGSITATAALMITEWALFDAVSGGNMLMREVYAPGHTLAIGGILNFIIKVQMTECVNE